MSFFTTSYTQGWKKSLREERKCLKVSPFTTGVSRFTNLLIMLHTRSYNVKKLHYTKLYLEYLIGFLISQIYNSHARRHYHAR